MKQLENVLEVLNTLKHRKPSRIYCPKCASPKINLSNSLEIWLLTKKYLCENCGYIGPIVMELEKEEESENGTA